MCAEFSDLLIIGHNVNIGLDADSLELARIAAINFLSAEFRLQIMSSP